MSAVPDEIAATELKIFIDNDRDLYERSFIPIVKNLVTKKAQGKYSSEKAPQAFMYLVEAGAKKYTKEYGGSEKWHDIFDVPTRKALAKYYTYEFEDEYALGNYDQYLPKKYRKNPGDCGCGCNGTGLCKNPGFAKQLKSYLSR